MNRAHVFGHFFSHEQFISDIDAEDQLPVNAYSRRQGVRKRLGGGGGKGVLRGSVVKSSTRNPGVLGSSRTEFSGFFRGSVLGQDTS